MNSEEKAELRGKLERFYEKHNPGKEVNIDQVVGLVEETSMDEHDLFTMLCKKYEVLYDPLDWKKDMIGKNTINGAGVSRVGVVNNAGLTEGARPDYRMDVPSTSSSHRSPRSSTRSPPPLEQHSDPVQDTDDGPMSPGNPAMMQRRRKLENFYKIYNPAKLADVDRIMDLASESTDEEIFESLCRKYNLPMKNVFEKLGITSDRFVNRALVDTKGSANNRSGGLREQLQSAEGRDKGEAVLRTEFAEWITNMLGLRPALTSENVFERLRDGVLLCRLVKTLNVKSTMKFHTKPRNHFEELANVEAFLKECIDAFGVENDELFDPQDLVKGAGELEQRAIMTLFLSIAKIAHTKFSSIAPQIVKLELEIEDTENRHEVTHEDLERMLNKKKEQAELEAAAKKEEEAERRRREREEAERKRQEEIFKRRREEKLAAIRRAKTREEERRLAEEQRRIEEEMEARRRHEAAAALRRREEEKLRRERERRRQADLDAARMRHSTESEDNPVFQYKNKKYVADKRDTLDIEVGRVMNNLPKHAVATQLYKLQNGMYVIEYPKRIVFFVRVCRNTVMIRVGGGWQSLEEFLLQRLRMYPEEHANYLPIIEAEGRDRVMMLHQTAKHMRYQM